MAATLLLIGEVGSISIAHLPSSKLPYDPAKGLVGVSELVRSDFSCSSCPSMRPMPALPTS